MQVSENVRELQPSATLAIATRAKELRAQGKNVIDLSAGEPDFATPEFICRGGIGAIEQGFTKYTAVAGIPALRQAIAKDLQRFTGKPIDPAGIVVSTGAKQALFNTIFTLFGPGDRVLLPAPYWTSYPDLIKIARAETVYVPGDESNSFKIDVAGLDRAYNGKTTGLILNSPSNPTGAVYSRDELDAIVRWASERGIWIVSDEIYTRLSYDGGPATSVLQLDDDILRTTVLINGASKSFAMTGWRVGFSYCEVELADKLAALQSHVSSNISTPSQYAALAAYKAEPPQDEAMKAMIKVFHGRRDMLIELLAEHLPNSHYVRPSGAFYLFLRVDDQFNAQCPDSIAFCGRLLDEVGVAAVPGSAFGDDRYIRLSFAASEEALTEGIRRIARAMHA
jgi:aspartate aminotransferase